MTERVEMAWRITCYNKFMDPDLIKKIEEQQKKIDEIYISVEKTRKYFKWTMIITLVVIVLPLLASILIIPSFISSYTSAMNDIGNLGF
jgi:hypothetical protein